MPFHKTTIALPYGAGERFIQNPVPGTKPTKAVRSDEVRNCNAFIQRILEKPGKYLRTMASQ
jgi:hypothetical protein